MEFKNLDDATLIREYLSFVKHSFNQVFGANAKRAANEIADILHARGISTIPNIFGTIEVTKFNIR